MRFKNIFSATLLLLCGCHSASAPYVSAYEPDPSVIIEQQKLMAPSGLADIMRNIQQAQLLHDVTTEGQTTHVSGKSTTVAMSENLPDLIANLAKLDKLDQLGPVILGSMAMNPSATPSDISKAMMGAGNSYASTPEGFAVAQATKLEKVRLQQAGANRRNAAKIKAEKIRENKLNSVINGDANAD